MTDHWPDFCLVTSMLPKALDEEVARAHLSALNIKITTLSPVQAEYLGLDIGGPYKVSRRLEGYFATLTVSFVR